METIRAMGMSLCVTAVVTSLFSMLIPNNKLERTLKFAVSLFFLISLVTPFLSGNLQFRFDLGEVEPAPANTRLVEAASRQFTALAEERLGAAVENLLAAQGVEVKKVAVRTTINEAGSICISRLEVTVAKADTNRKEEIEAVVRTETGVVPELYSQ